MVNTLLERVFLRNRELVLWLKNTKEEVEATAEEGRGTTVAIGLAKKLATVAIVVVCVWELLEISEWSNVDRCFKMGPRLLWPLV